MRPFSLNIRGRLVEYSRPAVMGIINVTPDSFYSASRAETVEGVSARVEQMLAEGVDIIDIGACSTRPGSVAVSADEEIARLAPALEAIRAVAPDIVISVDTFRPNVADIAIADYRADIINDVSGGSERMYQIALRHKAPYILTFNNRKSDESKDDDDSLDILDSALDFFSKKISDLSLMGVNDIILDPGFGFGKTLEQDHRLLRDMAVFAELHLPVLAGLSRKSMITKALGIEADGALAATVALNTIALQQGASILRVHDVKSARQTIDILRYQIT